MDVLSGLIRVWGGDSSAHRCTTLSIITLACLLIVVGGDSACLALQRHTLLPGEEAGSGIIHQSQTGQQSSQAAHGSQTTQTDEHGTSTSHAGAASSTHTPTPGQGEHTASQSQSHGSSALVPAPSSSTLHTQAEVTQGSEQSHGIPQDESELGHGEVPGGHAEGEAEHGLALPQISPVPGVTFVETMINLMDHELHGRFLGWRPNDLVVGRFTDNINNYQLGVLEAMRFTTLRLKDSLTRMGEADTYDRDLEAALNLLMNKATLFWFPSAESSYSEAVDHLNDFLEKLKTGRRSFYYRVDNLMSLISSYGDLLGNVNKSLAVQTNPDGSSVGWFESDDYFYYAKGVAHVLYEILRVVRVGFQDQLVTLDAVDIMDEVVHELHTAETTDPWIILNSDLSGFFANHRANLNAPLSEVAHLMGVLSRF